MGCFLLAGMLPDHGLFFQQGKILFHFRFIKKVLLPGMSSVLLSLAGTESFLVDNPPVPEGLFRGGFCVNNKTERSD